MVGFTSFSYHGSRMEVRSGTWQIAAGIFPHKSFSVFSLGDEKYRGVQYSTTEKKKKKTREIFWMRDTDINSFQLYGSPSRWYMWIKYNRLMPF
jgi:hypothetical protein